MNYSEISVVFQEIPGEISICFTITGCKINCKGCHSPFLWNEKNGKELTAEIYKETLLKYKGFATAVLFMGGEWHEEELTKNLRIAQNMDYRTCLYTGQETISSAILKQLTWLKTGEWKSELGGLNSRTTNQLFIEVPTNTNLNYLFLKN